MVSFNHYAFGIVGKFYYEYILGIKPATPGFEEVRIRPYTDKRIGTFCGSYRSRYGEIAVVYDGEALNITTPVETEITLPDGRNERVDAGNYRFVFK